MKAQGRTASRLLSYKRRRFLAAIEPLEDRRLLDVGGAHVFAQFSGALASSSDSKQFNIAINAPTTNFTLSGGRTLLGFWARADGSNLDPASVLINTAAGGTVAPQNSYPDLVNTSNRQSLVIANLTPGNYSLTVGAQRSSVGAFQLDVFLVGDVNGDRQVIASDGLSIVNRLGAVSGSPNYLSEADVNRDGRIDGGDYSLWRTNFGDATTLQPLFLTLAGLAPDPVHLPSGNLLTNTSAHQVLGSVTASATVGLETDCDAAFDEGTQTTGPGSFSFDLTGKLVEGFNKVELRAQDSFGQQRLASIGVILDTQAPLLNAGLTNDTAPGGGTNADGLTRDPTITGTVSDIRSRITGLKAGFDGAPLSSFFDVFADLSLDASGMAGSFTLSPERLNQIAGGTLDQGAHTLHIVGMDQAGNVSSFFDVFFELDTIQPLATGPTGTFAAPLSFFDVTYAGPMAGDQSGAPAPFSAFDDANYSLTIVGGPNDGQSVALEVAALSSSSIRVTPTTALPAQTYRLTIGDTVSDVAGNTVRDPKTFLFTVAQGGETQPPAITAELLNDTGLSNTDRITMDATIRGSVTDASPLVSFGAKVDGLPADSFFDVFTDLNADGSFAFSPSRLAQIRGSALGDGEHTLQLVAADNHGNVSSFFDITFTLDIVGTQPVFDLSAGSDTGEPGDQRTSAARVTLVGQAEPGSRITLSPGGATALASSTGTFQFVDLNLAVGDNAFTATAVDPAGNPAIFSRTIHRDDTEAGEDMVLRWNEIALEAVRRDATSPPIATRFLAMTHIAIFDVVSGIEGTPGYYVTMTPPSPISLDAAIAAAAQRVLNYAYPGQTSTFEAELNAVLDGISNGASEDNGLSFGRQVAEAIIAIRDSDGWDDYIDYVPNSTVGHWQPTPPMYEVGLLPHWGDVVPFAMNSTNQFRPGAPPSLNSPEYAAAFNEVKSLGRLDSTTRTEEQKEIARFWSDGPGTYTPPGHWNQIAREVVVDQGSSVSANARIFALLNIATADAAIACWDAKYFYDLWRPLTAIQRAGEDGNDATVADTTWQSLLITPPFPEYVSGHSTFSAAAAQILTSVVGDDVAFESTSFGLPGVIRNYSNFQEAAAEAGISRVYGGIHFPFGNTAGQATGQAIAQHVLARFSVQEDTQPPNVIIDSPLSNLTHPGDITVQGRVLDNLSGVDTLTFRLDGGPHTPLSFTSQGGFSLPLIGLADGYHTLHLYATDEAGNAGDPVGFAFTIDRLSPEVIIVSPTEDQVVEAGGRLIGVADPTGSLLISLVYYFDDGAPQPIPFNPASGEFNVPLDLSALTTGDHTLAVRATDAAGNFTIELVQLSLASAPPFTLSGVDPSHGSVDVGSTFRPRIDFSTAVNPETLTSDNFYATFSGQKLPATIVPASDGSFAWLFFTNPMPDASLIRVTVDGSTIMSANGSGQLDADSNGSPGGVRTFDFTTVSLVPLTNTSLSGKLVDPGPDLKPMTFDDVRAGADGALHTADDVFLLPIANVKVFILGLEDRVVYTDANGNFSFDSVPGGTIKLALDGRTATNAPDGYYFPEMVMDLEIEAGRANTIMGTMGTNAEKAANRDRPEVYLPRVLEAILETVSNTEVTVVNTIAEAAPNLSAEQRQFLTIEVQPGSAIGPDGQQVTSAQIGISTVPPELVRDMLPPGVLQHTFDITVQAPETATFTTPAPMTFPNVFNAAPGTKLNFLSFDHTTGLLVIEGTATVSADGLSVRTDPDTGITHPGWHGLTPPGGCGGDGGPPPPPPPPPGPEDDENEHDPEIRPMIFGESGGNFSKTWTAPPKNPDAPPPPPPPPPGDCGPPPPPDDEEEEQQPYLTVNIQVDGPLAEFMKQDPSATNALPLSSYSFTLQAGQEGTVILAAVAKKYDEMFGANGIKKLDINKLYGSQIKITEIRGNPDGSKTYDYYTYYLYRFVNGTDNKPNDTIDFEDVAVDALFGAERDKKIEFKAGGASMPTVEDANVGEPYFVLDGGKRINFDPTTVGDDRPGELIVKTPDGDEVPGRIKLLGDARKKQEVNVNTAGLRAALLDFANNYDAYGGTASVKAKFLALADADGSYTTFANSIKARVVSLYSGYDVTINDAQADAQASVNLVYHAVPPATNANLLGRADIVDLDTANLTTYFTTYTDYSKVQQGFQLDQYTNKTLPGEVNVYLKNFIDPFYFATSATLAIKLGNTITHEAGHSIGLNHPYNFTNAAGNIVATHPDIMSYGQDPTGAKSIHANYSQSTLKIGLNGTWATTNVTKANFNLLKGLQAGNYETIDGSDDLDHEDTVLPGPRLLVTFDDQDVLAGGAFDLGVVDVGTTDATAMQLINMGTEPLSISSLSLNGATAFSLAAPFAGTVLQPGEQVEVLVNFSPLIHGDAETTVFMVNNDATGLSSFTLRGHGRGVDPTIVVSSIQNNLGGVPVDAGVASVTELVQIVNDGAADLMISAIVLAEGLGRFTLTGVPTDLATNPLALAFGETFAFGVLFDPDHVGLDRALIDIVSNDPAHSVQRVSAVGTGLDTVVYPDWGNDYHAIDTPALPGSDTLRVMSDDAGHFEVFLPPSTPYLYGSFDPDTGLIAHSQGMTAASGQGVYLARTIVFGASTAADTDFDGLPDDIEHAIGTNPDKRDTNQDGADDFTAIQSGLDPLGLQGLPLGIIGTIKPQGTVDVQDVVASSDTAYLAAGAGGIQVVDISQITKPSVIASVPAATLGGNAVAVSFTSVPGATPGTFQNLVAAALGSAGLAIVDVTDPPAAFLVTRLPVPGSARSVQIVDNLAYVGGTGGLVSIVDMKSQELVATFTASGSGDVTAVKFYAGTLYTLRGGRLAAYNLAANLAAPPLLSSIDFGGATDLFVGSDRAYVTGNQVFEAVDITNPSNLQNTSGARPAINYRGSAANGSGRFVVAESALFTGDFRVGLFNIEDPDNTNLFLTEFETPGSAQTVFIQNGYGLVADGSGGLAIVNYLPFDQGTTPPTINVATSAISFEEVVEGSRLRIDVSTIDDVQTRQVTLSANGVALEPDGSFPFSFFVDVPTLASGATTLNLLITATDTGGNQSAQSLNLEIVEDTFPPQLLSVLPVDDRIQFNSIQSFRITFDEPLNPPTLTSANIHVVEAGPDGNLGTGDDVAVALSALEFDFRLSLNMLTIVPVSPLGPGKYELQLDRAAITDRAGNPLGSGVHRSQVTVQAIPFNAVIAGEIINPGQLDLYSFQADAGGQVTLFANWTPGGANLGNGQISLVAPDGTTVVAEGSSSSVLSNISLPATGLYTVRIRAASTHSLAQGAYHFTISDPEADYETIAYGQSKAGNFAVRGDDQEWQFAATAGDVVVFSYTGPELENGITLRNPDGTVESVLPAGSTLVRFAAPVSQTGLYRFVLETELRTGNYSIQLDQGSFTDLLTGSFNTVQNGTISPLYNVDRFSYHLNAGDVVTVYASLFNLGQGQLRLLDAAGAELVPPQSGGDAQITRYQSPVSQDVFVEVRGRNGNFHTGTYSLTVSSPETAFETLAYGGQETRSFAVRGDDQEWQFHGTAGDVVSLGYRGPHLEAGFSILRPDGSTLATFAAGSTLVQRDLALDQTGDHRFILADTNSTGAYTLNLANPADVESPGTALSANVTHTDSIGTVFDIDVFTFSAAAGQSFSVLGQWLSDLGSGEIQLINPSGTTVGFVSGSTASSLAVASAAEGTYVARVRATAGTGSFALGAYRVTVFSGAESPTNDTLATAVDTNIPGGGSSYDTTAFIGDNQHGVRDVDLYRVEAVRGDQIIAAITAAATGSDLDSYLRLFDSTGNPLAANNNFGNADSLLQYTVLQPGVYYIGVSSSGNSSYHPQTAGSGQGGSAGTYSLSLAVVQDHTGPTVTAVSPSGLSTREDVTSFTVTFSERLQPETATNLANYQLTKANDGVLDNGDDVAVSITSASYDDANRRVTLTLAAALAVGDSYRLTMLGTGAAPLTDIAGNRLNDGATSSHVLELVTFVGTPTETFPLVEPFETTSFDDFWSVATSGGGRVSLATTDSPHGGTGHVKLDLPTGPAGRSSITLLVDYSSLADDADVDLSFWHRENDSNQSMPASFSGRVNADGVAISNDGVNWVRIDDLGATTDGGYTNHVIDLDGAVRAAGLTLEQPLQILFQHYFTSTSHSAYFDDIRLAPDLAGPTITSLSTPGPLVFSNTLSSISIDFSEPLTTSTAVASTSYQLLRNGSTASFTATYDSALRRVTLNTGSLTPASYQLRVRGAAAGAGVTQVRDAAGNPLNNGVDSVYTFEVFSVESPLDDETDSATATGLTPAGGSYSLTTAIGNNGYSGRDVDLYRFTAEPGDRVTLETRSQGNYGSLAIDTVLRLFDSGGNEIAVNDNHFGTDSFLDQFILYEAGTYFVGVSTAVNDDYNPLFAPSGTTGPLGKYQVLITLTPDNTPPQIASVVPHAGPNLNPSLQTVEMNFDEPVDATSAGSAANYSLTHLGADGTLGGGDDTPYTFTAAYDDAQRRTTLTLTGPESLLPLPFGRYQLTATGTTGGIVDLAGNRLRGGVNYVQDFRLIEPEDPLNDRLANAYATGIQADGGSYTVDGAIGDNAFAAKDVDLYAFEARAGLRLFVDLTDQSLGSPLSARLRLFNSAGLQLDARENASTDDSFFYEITAPGTYYIGVSGSGNHSYNPNSPGSGGNASTTGEYILSIETEDVIPPTVSSITPSGIVVNPTTAQILIQFSEPLEVTPAELTSSYAVVLGGPDRRIGTADDVTLPTSAYTAFYDVGAARVRLDFNDPLPNGDVRLTLLQSALVDRAGLHLNGGVNEVRIFSIVTAGADLPFFDPLDTGPSGPHWTTSLSDSQGVVEITSVGGPRRGAGHLRLTSTAQYEWTNAVSVLAVNAAGAAELELSFYEKRGEYENSYGLPASFTGNVLGDGVAIGVDGTNWYRVVDLTAQSSTLVYDHYVVDLAAAAAAHGLSLSGTLLVRFSNSEYYGFFDTIRYARYFDDIRVAAGATAPLVSNLTIGTFLHAATPVSLGVVFSESVTSGSATDVANYQLVRAGVDRLLGTADDVDVAISGVTYDDALRTATLTAAATLPTDVYRVTVLPGIVDASGVSLNEGLAQSRDFDVAASETSEDQTTATATVTGLTSAVDGTYSIGTAVGNSSHGALDVDHYRLSGATGQRLAVTLSQFGANQAPLKLRLLNQSGVEIASTTTLSGPNAQLVLTLTSTQDYFVSVSANNAPGGHSLYRLEIETNVGVAVPPFTESFEDSALPLYFTSYSDSGTAAIAPTDVSPGGHTGTRSLALGDTTFNFGLREANMTIDGTALDQTTLRFFAYFPYYEFYSYLYPLNPAGGSFTGHFNGDGVAFSVDGTTWYPLLDYATLRDDGQITNNSWHRFNVDLTAAAVAVGVTLTDHTQVRFQNYGYGYLYDGYYGYTQFIDDITVAEDVVGPTVTAATGLDSFVVATDVTSLMATFNESLEATTADLPTNYNLLAAGSDQQFDTVDDIVYSLTPAYNDATRTTTLAVAGAGTGLPTGLYRFRLVGTGINALSDESGNLLYDGVNQDFVFTVFPPESVTNNTLDSATETGLTAAGGGYSTIAMLGNDSGPNATFDDEDFYALDAEAGSILQVTAASRFGTPNLMLRLFDAAGEEITSLSPSDTNGVALDSYVLPADGVYYVVISEAANSAYDPETGQGDTGLTRGLYEITLQIFAPAAFPFADGFETGSLALTHWDVFTFASDATLRFVDASTYPGPITGNYSAQLVKNSLIAGNGQTDLTLHLDLAGQTNVELRFNEQNIYDYSYSSTFPDVYDGRYQGSDGVFLSVDGETFYRIPTVFNESPTGIRQRVIDLDEVAASRGLTLSAHTLIRFSADHYYYDQYQYGRLLDDVQVILDTTGPVITQLTHTTALAGGSPLETTNSLLLNDEALRLTASFDDRLDPARAGSPAEYEFRFAGLDGYFLGAPEDTGDDVILPLAPAYDGDRTVVLTSPAAPPPFAVGVYRLTFRGASTLTDAEGNPLNGGADSTYFFNMIDPGPRLTTVSPANDALIAPATGFSSVDVTFNEAVLASSFTGADVQITDSDGFVVVDSANITVTGSGTSFTASWPAIHAPGRFTVRIGPNITDLAGNKLNQNHDTINGDTYATQVRVSDTITTGTLVNLRDAEGFLYDIYVYYGYLNDGGRYDPPAGAAKSHSDSYNGYHYFQVNGSYYYNSDALFALQDDGSTIVLPSRYNNGLRVHREIYVPAADETFVRYVDVFENPGTTPLTRQVRYFGSTSSSVITADSSGNLAFGANDTYLATDDSVDGGTSRLSLGHVFMDGAALTMSSASGSPSSLDWRYNVTIGPGQTVRLMSFETQQLTRAEAAAQATALIGLPEAALANLTEAEQGTILNFATGFDSLAPYVSTTNPVLPADLQTNVSTISATFSEPLTTATAADAANYRLISAGPDQILGNEDDVVIALTPTYDETTRTVALSIANAPLESGTYRLQFLAGITDAADNELGGGAGQSYDFRVILGPRINYANNDEHRSTPGWSRMYVGFDRAIDGTSFSGGDISITDSNGNVVVDAADMTVSGDGADWTVDFASPLTTAGQYFVAIGPNINDTFGHAMNQDFDVFRGETPDDIFTRQITIYPYLLDGGHFIYDLDPYDGALNDGGRIEPDTGNQTHGDSYDGAYYLYVDGDYYGTNGAFSMSADGRTAILETWSLEGLDVHREIYVPTADSFVRYVDVLHNPSDAPITRTIRWEANFGSDSSTVVTASASGNLQFDLSDTYLATDDADGAGDLSLAHVFMDGLGEVTLSHAQQNSDDLAWEFVVTVNPGETVSLMSFFTQQLTRADSHAKAVSLVGLPETALAGLSDEVRASIINFDVPLLDPLRVDASSPSLATATAEPLTLLEMAPLMSEAVARWVLAGADAQALASLEIEIRDLGGDILALAGRNTIWLDDNAAGRGWYLDADPATDDEFTAAGGPPAGIDALTALMHEIGHILGRDHQEEGLMNEVLSTGRRKNPLDLLTSEGADDFFSELGNSEESH